MRLIHGRRHSYSEHQIISFTYKPSTQWLQLLSLTSIHIHHLSKQLHKHQIKMQSLLIPPSPNLIPPSPNHHIYQLPNLDILYFPSKHLQDIIHSIQIQSQTKPVQQNAHTIKSDEELLVLASHKETKILFQQQNKTIFMLKQHHQKPNSMLHIQYIDSYSYPYRHILNQLNNNLPIIFKLFYNHQIATKSALIGQILTTNIKHCIIQLLIIFTIILQQSMGNTQNHNKPEEKISQLSTMRNDRFLNPAEEEDFLETVYCCYKLWRKNLQDNFIQLQKVVHWVPYVENAYRNNQHNRDNDLKELEMIKSDWEERSDTSAQANVSKLVERTVIVNAGSSLSKKNSLRRSVSLKQRSSAARSVVISRASRSPRPINRQSSCENINQIFANKKYYFDKATADSLYLFTLFSDFIEKQFKQTDTIFFKIKDTFIDYIANNSSDKDQLISDIHHFIKLVWQTIVDYYKVDDLDSMSGANSFFTEENMETLTTSILFRNSIIHARIFQSFLEVNNIKQRQLENAIYKLRDTSPEGMTIKAPYCLTTSTIDWFQKYHNYQPESPQPALQPYYPCIQKLRQLQDTRTPAGKLKILVSTADLIIDCINKFYQKRGMQTTLQALDADQVLCIYSYILVKSRVKNLHSHLNIIQMYSSEGQLLSQTGYYFSVVSTALQSLLNTEL